MQRCCRCLHKTPCACFTTKIQCQAPCRQKHLVLLALPVQNIQKEAKLTLQATTFFISHAVSPAGPQREACTLAKEQSKWSINVVNLHPTCAARTHIVAHERFSPRNTESWKGMFNRSVSLRIPRKWQLNATQQHVLLARREFRLLP